MPASPDPATFRARGPIDQLSLVWSQWFGAGLSPRAPGTVGTLAALPFVALLQTLKPAHQWLAIVALFLVSVPAVHRAGRILGVVDARQIVIDEVIGIAIALAGAPFHMATVLLAFGLFRLFDIVKPWPASYFDRQVKNGAGVILDDVVAGLFARACLWGAGLLWPAWFGVR